MDPDIENCLIKKEIIHTGTVYKPLRDGCKVRFHFQTRTTDSENRVIDDSRIIGKKEPMTLVLGKKFKLEVWEVIVKKMSVNEVAKFTVDKSLVIQYPFVSKTLRDLDKSSEGKRTHFCSMTLQNEGIGYKDLNELISKPSDLEFIIELLGVEYPEDYEKDGWQLSDEEKVVMIPKLKEKGNDFFRNKQYTKAAESYSIAIGYSEQLMNKEKPHDEDWNNLNEIKVPILLNYCQCKLFEEDYYPVIEHCSKILETHPDNVKALFRRGKAYSNVWSPAAAIKDFNKVKELDPSLTVGADKELKVIEKVQKERDEEDKIRFKSAFT